MPSRMQPWRLCKVVLAENMKRPSSMPSAFANWSHDDPFSYTQLSVICQRAYAGTNDPQGYIQKAEDAMARSQNDTRRACRSAADRSAEMQGGTQQLPDNCRQAAKQSGCCSVRHLCFSGRVASLGSGELYLVRHSSLIPMAAERC